MTSRRINKTPLGLRSINFFNFADISKIFKIIMKVIYLDIKSETRIVWTPFHKLSSNNGHER